MPEKRPERQLLVYGRKLQQPAGEAPSDPLDVSAITREQCDALKRRILAANPHLVEELASQDVPARTPASASDAWGLGSKASSVRDRRGAPPPPRGRFSRR